MPIGTEVGLGPDDIVLDGDPAPLPKKGAEPQFSAHFYCGQTAGCIKMPLGMDMGLGPGHIVLDGDPAPLSKKGQSPQFSAHVYYGQTDQDAIWYEGRPRFTRHCVKWGPSSPSPKGTHTPFSANVRCGQTAGWTKMPLGIEVASVQATLSSMGTQLAPEKRAHPPRPNFWPMSIVAKRLDGSICYLVRRYTSAQATLC